MLDVKRNLTTMTDFYELTMSAGYLDEGYVDKIAVFDMFFRRVPDGGGYAIMAGLQQFIDAVDHLKFTGEDIDYLRSTKAFDEKFLTNLANFKLHCNIWAIEEGMPIFPQEPIDTVEGPAIECQLLETLLLVTFNHQCLIATKANRIVSSAAGRPVMEFGARRAQGYDAAYFGARASYIGGCGSTSCVMAARDFGIPASGTMAHSGVQMFPTEYDAFKKYAEMYPDACVLLADTYNVLRLGVPDAIKVFDEVLKPMGKRPKGIRIDSGDIAYLSKKARKMLDEAGYPDCTICASNSLDEYPRGQLRHRREHDHGLERPCVRRRLQAGRRQGGRRQLHPEDEAVRIRREDDDPLPEKGLAYLRPGRQGDGRPYHDGRRGRRDPARHHAV